MTIKNLYHSSLDSLERGEYKLAREIYEEILELGPNVKDIHFLMGTAFFEYNRLEDALAAFSRALINDEDLRVETHLQMSAIFLELGFIKRSIKFINKALEIDPDHFDAQLNLALILSTTGQNKKAIEAYRRALEIDPYSYVAYTNLGIEFQDKGDIDRAIAYHKKSLEYNSFYSLAWYNLSCAYALNRNINKSLQALKKAVRLDEEHKEDARYDPELEILAASPIFQNLIR